MAEAAGVMARLYAIGLLAVACSMLATAQGRAVTDMPANFSEHLASLHNLKSTHDAAQLVRKAVLACLCFTPIHCLSQAHWPTRWSVRTEGSPHRTLERAAGQT